MASPLYLWAETKLDRRNGIIKRERAYHMLYTISILYIFWMSYVQLISVLCPGRGGGGGGGGRGGGATVLGSILIIFHSFLPIN